MEHYSHSAPPPVSTYVDAEHPGLDGLPAGSIYSGGLLTIGDGFPENGGQRETDIHFQAHGWFGHAYGPKLFRGNHNMNLTLDQKRTLVIPRGAHRKGKDGDNRGHQIHPMGSD